VIYPFQPRLMETTLGTHPCWRIELNRLGLNSCDEEKHGPPGTTPASLYCRVSGILFPVVNRDLLLRKREIWYAKPGQLRRGAKANRQQMVRVLTEASPHPA
jgi:hypothetical protein